MTKTIMIAHGSAAVQAARIIAAVADSKASSETNRPIVAEQQGGETVKTHEAMTEEGVCPRCNEGELYQDSVDVGVGVIYGPWGCPCCGWSESEKYDLAFGGGLQDNGSYLDPYGGLTPADNPIAKMLTREAKTANRPTAAP